MDSLPARKMRRRTLQLLGGGAALGLSACCWRPNVPPIPDAGIARSPRRILVPMDPPVKLAAAQAIIDVHGHFFNGTDASIADYLTESVGHTAPDYQELLRRLKPVVLNLICLAPTAAEEYHELTTMAQTLGAQSDAVVRTALAARMTQRSKDVARELWREIRQQEGLEAEFQRLLNKERASAQAFGPDFIEQALDPFKPDVKASLQPVLETDVEGLLNFVYCMLRPRWHNLQQFRLRYEPEGVVAVANAMVDFDGWYSPPAISPPEDQVKLLSLLATMSEGYMIPLVSFNPWSADSRSNLDLVRTAVERYGFGGVKLYPPMGFWAAGNTHLPAYPGRRPPDLAAMERRLEALFDYCTTKGVPVLAHANSSMGPNSMADNYSGPAGWQALIRRYAGSARSPRIILGHFGGGSAESASIDDAPWPARFAGLMGKPGAETLYGDTGMWTELAACQQGQRCEAVDRVLQAKLAYPGLAHRLMYGSDWFMLVRTRQWWTFPAVVRAALGPHLDPARLMFGNAAECLGLGKASAAVVQAEPVEDHWRALLHARLARLGLLGR